MILIYRGEIESKYQAVTKRKYPMFQIIVMFLVYWAIFGLIIGLLAKWKNRNGLLWGIVGGPFLILGLLLITCMPFLCPKCRKKVKRKWKKNICSDCGSNLKTGGKVFRTIIMVGSIPAVLIALFILTSSISMFVKGKSSQKSSNYAESEASDPEVVKVSKTDRIKLLKDKFFELVNTCEGFEKKEPSYKELIQWRVDLASLRDAVLVLFESSHACDTELEEIKVALVTMTQTFELIDTRNIERKDLMTKFDSVIKKLKEEAKIIISNPDNYSEEISKDFVNDYNIFINSLYGLESLNKRELGLFLDIARFYTDLFRSFAQIYDKKSNQALQSKHSTDRAKKSIDNFDIKGFKLGMTINEAEDIIYQKAPSNGKLHHETKIEKIDRYINGFSISEYIYQENKKFGTSGLIGDGVTIRFTNDEYGGKIFVIDLCDDLDIDAVDECEFISKKAIKKYGEPTQKKKLLDDNGELYGWTYCWGDCDWNEKNSPDGWRMENAKLLIYQFHRSWLPYMGLLPGTARLNVRLWDSAYPDKINARFEKEQKEKAMEKMNF